MALLLVWIFICAILSPDGVGASCRWTGSGGCGADDGGNHVRPWHEGEEEVEEAFGGNTPDQPDGDEDSGTKWSRR